LLIKWKWKRSKRSEEKALPVDGGAFFAEQQLGTGRLCGNSGREAVASINFLRISASLLKENTL
jgi:hypothetical protein